jgi:hypothetical protein
VAGALGRDLEAAVACEAHDLDHVVGRLGDGDGGGTLVHLEVPCQAGLVPVGVLGGDDLARDARAKPEYLEGDYVDCLDGVLHFEVS